MTSAPVMEFAPEANHVRAISGDYYASFAVATPNMRVPSIYVLPETVSVAGLLFCFDIENIIPPDLKDALDDLGSVVQDAVEEGLDEPSPEAIENAERVLLIMYGLRRYRYEVYPATARAVIVDCPYDRGSVMAMCEPNGEVLLFLNANGKQTSERVASINDGRVSTVLGSYMRELGVRS